MSRVSYLIQRTVQTVLVLWLLLTFLFILFRSIPGDPTTVFLFQGMTPESAQALEEHWGFNDPLYVQYINYMVNFVTLDPGYSVHYQVPVWDFVKIRIVNSFILAAPAITLAYIVGSVFGAYLATRANPKVRDNGVIPLIITGTFPEFFTAIVLIIIFSVWLGIFPVQGMTSLGTEVDAWWQVYFTRDFAWHYTLPATAVFLRYLFVPTLVMRNSASEVSGQGFIDYARMTGLSENTRLRKTMKHASLPVITIFPISLTSAFSGLVLIETVFNWPGIGFALVEAVFNRDYAVLQFCFFIVAAFIIIANYVVDIAYGVIDPRVSVETEGGNN